MLRVRFLERETEVFPQWDRTAAEVAEEQARFPVRAERFAFHRSIVPVVNLFQLPHEHLVTLLDPDSISSAFANLFNIRVRKNQKDLTPTEWASFISAVETIAASGAPTPTFHDFVSIHEQAMDPANHAGHAWGVHTMPGHDGRNFLAWHREYVARFEARLQLVNPTVTVPYWDWMHDRSIPAALANPADLTQWNISRGTFQPGMLPTAEIINTVLLNSEFAKFQTALEGPHGWVHNAVGGTMKTSSSPADPLFWLHHAMVDKLWADWQTPVAPGKDPSNADETLQPLPIIQRKVSKVLKIKSLRYTYA